MADISHLITLGIGTPGDISHFLLLGLTLIPAVTVATRADVTFVVSAEQRVLVVGR